MTVLTTFVVIVAFVGSAINHKNRWPGCTNKDTRVDHRDWRAWYKKLNNSGLDIKVHVYRDPPFNWLHPVRHKCKNTTQNARLACLLLIK